MSTAYRLYDQLKADPSQEAAARSALAVAGDVHEIKKEYFLIMRGISEVLDQELKSSGMYMDEILHLLKGALTRLGKEKGKEVVCSIHCPHRLYTTSHYAWMSVFRNLFTNARPDPRLFPAGRDHIYHTDTKDRIYGRKDDMMKFYLLDDDRNIRRILTQIITDRELGTVCGAGSNGHEGLEEVFDLKPDIIIADLLMPEMDGITFVEHARPGLPDTAFIMLSQVSSKEMISAAYEAGVR